MNKLYFILLFTGCCVFFSSCGDSYALENADQCVQFEKIKAEANYVQNEEHKKGQFINKYCALGASTASMQWQENVAKTVAIDYNNYAIPGCRWAYNPNLTTKGVPVIMNQVFSLIQEKEKTGYYPDLITIMCGLNDAVGGGIGTCEDAFFIDDLFDITREEWYNSERTKSYRETVYGSIRFVIEKLKHNFPESHILIMTPQQINNPTYNNQKILRINEVIKVLAKYYSIPVIDVYNECGINSTNFQFYLDKILVHPNKEGEKLMAVYVEKQIRLKYSYSSQNPN